MRFFQLSDEDFNLPKRSETLPPSRLVGMTGDWGNGLSARLCASERDSCRRKESKKLFLSFFRRNRKSGELFCNVQEIEVGYIR